MKNLALDADERIVASLVPDDPEHLYKHKNQIAAVTNKRLIFIRYTGISPSFEGSYALASIDIRIVTRVRHVTTFAIGGLLAGIIVFLAGIAVLCGGLTGELVGPGVIFIPLVAIPSGVALIFGLRRRTLVFETTTASHKWVSDPLAFRKTQDIAASVCEYFRAFRHGEIDGTESWLTDHSAGAARGDRVLWYHYVIVLLFPYVGVFWGIINLIRGKKRSGLVLLLGSIGWYVVIGVLLALLLSR